MLPIMGIPVRLPQMPWVMLMASERLINFAITLKIRKTVIYSSNATISGSMTPTVFPIPSDTAPSHGGNETRSARQTIKAVALVLARHEIRCLRRWFEDFDRDILLPILLGEIALHNIGALQHGVARRSSTRPITEHPSPAHARKPKCDLKPCNAYSIAAATGLPRETVRRKIGRLIELGWISRQVNGHLFITEAALEQFGSMLSSRALSELLETADRVRALLDGKQA